MKTIKVIHLFLSLIAVVCLPASASAVELKVSIPNVNVPHVRTPNAGIIATPKARTAITTTIQNGSTIPPAPGSHQTRLYNPSQNLGGPSNKQNQPDQDGDSVGGNQSGGSNPASGGNQTGPYNPSQNLGGPGHASNQNQPDQDGD